MTDLDLISIGAKHSTPGQFSREFTEEQWISAGRAIESAAVVPLLERIAELTKDVDHKDAFAEQMGRELSKATRQLAELEAKLAQQADPMSRIAKSKLADLIADGYRECGVMIDRTGDDGAVKRGAVSNGGMVIWWHPAQQAEAQEPVYWQWRRKADAWSLKNTFNTEVIQTTTDSEVRALFPRPQPAQLQRLGKDEWASVFRDASAAFFSDGCKNLTEQVNACAHAAMRATEFALEAKNGAVLK